MGVASQPDLRHQEGIVRLLVAMDTAGVTILEAGDGHHKQPRLIQGKRPDVVGVARRNFSHYAVGEVTFSRELGQKQTQSQLGQVALWARQQRPPARLFLGVIDDGTNHFADEFSMRADGWKIVRV